MKRFCKALLILPAALVVMGLLGCEDLSGGGGGNGGPEAILTASVNGLVAPVQGQSPLEASALISGNTAQYVVQGISWASGNTPLTGKFAAGTSYTATITLKAQVGYKFTVITPGVNVGTPSVGAISADSEGNTLSFTVSFGATDQPSNQEDINAANDFKDDYTTILAKTTENVDLDDEAAVDAALTEYNNATEEIQDLLCTEKSKLDELKTKIAELKAVAANQEAANTFKTDYSVILLKTTTNIEIADESAVDAVLAAYGSLSQVIKDLLGTEKSKLDDLKDQIEVLKANIVTEPPVEIDISTPAGVNALLQLTDFGSDANTISKSNNSDPYILSTISAEFDSGSYRWLVDGEQKSTADKSASFYPADYNTGIHYITLLVSRNGIQATRVFSFTVTE
jgi:hypothetical protein